MATYQKRGESWRVIVRRKGYDPQTRTFRRKGDAEKWAKEIEERMEGGHFRADLKLTVAALFERYAAEVSPTKSGARWEKIRLTRLTRTCAFCKKPLGRLTGQDIKLWRDKRLTEVKPASVHREMNLVSSVFSHAIKEWGIRLPHNPVSEVKRPPKGKPRNRRIAAEELTLLWTAAGGRKPSPVGRTIRTYVMWMFEFCTETALRVGEATRLEWADVHLEDGWLHVGKSKNGDARDVPLTPGAKAILATLDCRDARVFPVSLSSSDTVFRKLVKKAGVADLHFHDSRHEAISRLAKKLHVLELARVVGHRDIKSLMVYYNPTAAELAAKLA